MQLKSFLALVAIAVVVTIPINLVLWSGLGPRLPDAGESRQILTALSAQAERLDRLQASTLALDSKLEASNADFYRELDRLTAQIRTVHRRSTPPQKDSKPRSLGGEAREESIPEQQATLDDWVDPLSAAYEREWTQSDWGQSAVEAIDAAIPSHPFFSRHGGDWVTDCRVTTCRIEWVLPTNEQLSMREREDLFAEARYELLALAASTAKDVGQLSTDWSLDGPTPRIATTFQRLDASR